MGEPTVLVDRSTAEMNNQIVSTWGDYDDFKRGGFDYVAFILEHDAQDIKDREDENDAIQELADVCINARRMMLHKGYDPDEEILDRLFQHTLKGQEDIIEKYEGMYYE